MGQALLYAEMLDAPFAISTNGNGLPGAVPPREVQKRIVSKVDELMTLCDDLEQRERNRVAELFAHSVVTEVTRGIIESTTD